MSEQQLKLAIRVKTGFHTVNECYWHMNSRGLLDNAHVEYRSAIKDIVDAVHDDNYKIIETNDGIFVDKLLKTEYSSSGMNMNVLLPCKEVFRLMKEFAQLFEVGPDDTSLAFLCWYNGCEEPFGEYNVL